jgi:DNA-binding XRE family transcriptional regulator
MGVIILKDALELFEDGCHIIGRQVERITTLPRKPNFARYLRDARANRGLSVAEVAEQVGVSTASIYFWESDHVRPRDANLSALCKVLKLPSRQRGRWLRHNLGR